LGYCPEERQQVFPIFWPVSTKQHGVTFLKNVILVLSYREKTRSHSQLPVCMITADGGEEGKNRTP
jgi:hypothetical protein